MLDLGVFHRHAHVVSIRGSAGLDMRVGLAGHGLQCVCVFPLREMHRGRWVAAVDAQLSGREAATQFFTAYVLEESLSADNIFVIAMIFAYFRMPLKNQHRLLFWGILGAIVLRGIMIGLGATLIHRFEWITYVFGGCCSCPPPR